MKPPLLRLLLIAGVLLAVSACQPAPRAQIQIPTLAALPSQYSMDGAERVGREFLQNWHDGNPERMFELISFGSRDATPRDTFLALYQTTADQLTLTDLEIEPRGIFRENESVAVLNYDVIFHTDMFGDITDSNRDMRLVVDGQAQDWRIAWTPAEIFPELAEGGQLAVLRIQPNRANIYDRNGVVLADQEGRIASVRVVRQDAPDWENCILTLSQALSLPTTEVRARLEARPPTELVDIGTIDEQTYNALEPQLDGFCKASYEGRRVRRYTDGTLMPHLLGYVGFPDEAALESVADAGFTRDSMLGRSGIELNWDATLRGTPSARLVIQSPTGQVLRELGGMPAQPGRSLWLTIDSEFQREVTRILAEAFTQAKDSWAPGSPGASIVVMDVRTGDVLAMVSYPGFDNNAYNSFPAMGREAAQQEIAQNAANPRHPEVNRPAQGVFALGSVMKTITAAAAANSGVYALDQRYTCTGSWNRDIPRSDWLAGGHGTLTLAGSLTQSCNPYYYEAGYQLYMADPDILPEYARRFGFGAPTGIPDIPEESGFIPDPDWFFRSFGTVMPFSEEVNMAIGQGYVQVTPLQVARWTSAIASGGTLYTPHLVRAIGLIGETPDPAYQVEGIPTGLRPEVLDVLHSGMCAVTSTPAGTAEFVFRNSPLQAIGVCGKTGTAQTGGPSTPSHAWFTSYAPRDNPEIAVTVLVETAGQGSEIAAPIARQVLEAYFDLGS
ncbi:MAG TPA: penicillin-binding transpeptidase domain-containing protein [Candidatus Limnocylindrales bacterium]|nr:penicillin-binding transpeptidase domain-containing protein [Candidatus Limnocylindrales bacterium]